MLAFDMLILCQNERFFCKDNLKLFRLPSFEQITYLLQMEFYLFRNLLFYHYTYIIEDLFCFYLQKKFYIVIFYSTIFNFPPAPVICA